MTEMSRLLIPTFVKMSHSGLILKRTSLFNEQKQRIDANLSPNSKSGGTRSTN